MAFAHNNQILTRASSDYENAFYAYILSNLISKRIARLPSQGPNQGKR